MVWSRGLISEEGKIQKFDSYTSFTFTSTDLLDGIHICVSVHITKETKTNVLQKIICIEKHEIKPQKTNIHIFYPLIPFQPRSSLVSLVKHPCTTAI